MDEVIGAEDPEEVKAAKERVIEAGAECTAEAKKDVTDLHETKKEDISAELQEQLARLACLDPLAVTRILYLENGKMARFFKRWEQVTAGRDIEVT